MFSWQDFCVSCLVLRGPAQSTCTWTCHVTRAISRENLQEKRCVPEVILCEPAQSKCTWICHKKHFVRKFAGKMPNASDTTSIDHRALTPIVRTSGKHQYFLHHQTSGISLTNHRWQQKSHGAPLPVMASPPAAPSAL
jgi:hypothetical protein